MKRFAAVAVTVLIAAAVVATTQVFAAAAKQDDTLVQLLAINDFHGNLQPPQGSSGRITTGVGQTVDAGGVAYLATWLNTLEQGSPNETTFRVGAGDLIGASPLISGLFHDEPTIEAMNALHLDVTGVGNHEFDEGLQELLRMQFGNQHGGDGCHPVDGCQDGTPFGGSLFQYLAANVFYQGTNDTILPPYEIKKVGNAKIAFIGLTLEGTPLIVTPAGVAGLDFKPEVATVNSLVQRLRANEGVRTFVVLIHQGGQQNPPYPLGYQDVNRCDNPTGDIFPIVQALDPQVDVVISAHTHQPYICTVDGKLVTSASSFGRLITDIDLRIDHQSKDVTAATARNVIVTRGVAPDADQQAIIDKYNTISAPIANRVVGSITADITRTGNAAGESALGDVIADAQLASTAPTDFGAAVVAFMNPGGIRADLTFANSTGGEAPGQITYNELFTVQPFNNVMTVKTLTGAQIEQLLEQQWCGTNLNAVKFLQVSAGFTYSYDGAGLTATQNTTGNCDRVSISDIEINGAPIQAAGQYRVAMNSFLATGGDGFGVFNAGTDQLGGEIDLDAAVNYFLLNSPVSPGPQDRITRIG